MHENSKYTLDFLDTELKKLSKICFNIDRESRAILGIIAKHGPSSETRITGLGKRRIILSREIVRYRILKSDLSGNDNFLLMKKGKKIGNLQKIEKLYSLTFKGILASLSEVSLRENFWIKHYMNMITDISDEITAQEFLFHIYCHIVVFLIFNSKKEGMLTNYKNPETDFYDEYYPEGAIGNLIAQQYVKGIPIEFKDIFVNSLVQFFVSVDIVGNLLKKSLKIDYDSTNTDDMTWKYEEYVDNFFRRWMWTMFLIIDYTPKQILKLYERDEEDDSVEDVINILDEFGEESGDTFSFMAEEELKRIDHDIDYDPYASLFAN